MSARSGAFVSTLTTLGERKSRDNNHAAEPDTIAAGSLISLSTGPSGACIPWRRLVPDGLLRYPVNSPCGVSPPRHFSVHVWASGVLAAISLATFVAGSSSSNNSQGGRSALWGFGLEPPAVDDSSYPAVSTAGKRWPFSNVANTALVSPPRLCTNIAGHGSKSIRPSRIRYRLA